MKGVYKMSEPLKQEAAAYRESLYGEAPAVKRFAKLRKAALFSLMALLLHILLKLFSVLWYHLSFSYVLSALPTLLFNMVLLALPLLGGWKNSFVLYLPAFINLFTVFSSADFSILASFFDAPLLSLLFLLELLYPVLLCITAVWLTIFPQSRQYADHEQRIRMAYMRYVNEHFTFPA